MEPSSNIVAQNSGKVREFNDQIQVDWTGELIRPNEIKQRLEVRKRNADVKNIALPINLIKSKT